MKHNSNPVFPEGFLWGASSAAWQVEGATLEDKATFEWMFAQYHQLGANGVMDHVHQEFIQMETKDE